jgi:elongation factor G
VLRVRQALAALIESDPQLSYDVDPESGQMILKGLGELELETAILRLRDAFKLGLKIGAPQVAYRETITRTVQHAYTHKSQANGTGQFAKVNIRFEALPPESGFVFENASNALPAEYVAAVEAGVTSAKTNGVIAGFPLIDVKATLIDGQHHDTDSSAWIFEMAARACFREAIPKAGPKVLEPMMKVEVVTPEEFLGSVIGDLNSRRGMVTGLVSRDGAQVVTAIVPLANMLGYGCSLQSMCQGDARFTLQFDHYEQIPSSPDDPDTFPPAMALR